MTVHKFLAATLLPLALVVAPSCGTEAPTDEAATDSDGAAGSKGDGGSGDTSQPSGTGGTTSSSSVTWHADIAPLVAEKCGGCHSDGGIAPFSMDTYAEAAPWASRMLAAIKDGTMPPWGAEETDECTPPADFKDDLRLKEAEKSLFEAWVDGGHPEGDETTAAPLPSPPALQLTDSSRDITIPSSVTVEGTQDDFVCFTLDPEISDEVWMTGIQATPGNSAIVHHALVFLDRAGDGENLADDRGQYKCFGGPGISSPSLLGAWAPGAVPAVLPDNTGVQLSPGDKLVVQVHYHPTGQGPETDDSTSISLRWTEQAPEYVAVTYLIGNFETENLGLAGGDGYGLTTGPDFAIPAGATAHQEINRFLLDDGGNALARQIPIYVWEVGTHMHYVGTDMRITATKEDGEEQCLVQTPRWDFNWQRGYFYEGEVEELPVVNLGDTLTMRCTYDNSTGNPFVREALDAQGLSEPKEVKLGEETLDEMCLGVFGFAVHRDFAEDFGFSRPAQPELQDED